jgi:hypothetical protein
VRQGWYSARGRTCQSEDNEDEAGSGGEVEDGPFGSDEDGYLPLAGIGEGEEDEEYAEEVYADEMAGADGEGGAESDAVGEVNPEGSGGGGTGLLEKFAYEEEDGSRIAVYGLKKGQGRRGGGKREGETAGTVAELIWKGGGGGGVGEWVEAGGRRRKQKDSFLISQVCLRVPAWCVCEGNGRWGADRKRRDRKRQAGRQAQAQSSSADPGGARLAGLFDLYSRTQHAWRAEALQVDSQQLCHGTFDGGREGGREGEGAGERGMEREREREREAEMKIAVDGHCHPQECGVGGARE